MGKSINFYQKTNVSLPNALPRKASIQGLWDFKTEFLYQIYTRKIRIWGCDMADYLKV